MTERILGRGVRFPFRPGPDGRFAFVEGEENVAQSLQLILSTALGERQMRYRFGSELPRLIFEPVTSATLATIEESAAESVRAHEERVRVRELRAEPDPDVPSRVVLTVEYDILQTHRRGSLVFPFYLQGG
ncbi:MAG: GPW/gp25 family protein [Gemmatimonadota bacterium]